MNAICIQLPQAGEKQCEEMGMKIVETSEWTTSKREVKPVIRLRFIKVTELADRPHHSRLVLKLSVILEGPMSKLNFKSQLL